MDQNAPYIHWGFIQISLSNLVLILVMLAIFAAALVIPFPGHRERSGGGPESGDDD